MVFEYLQRTNACEGQARAYDAPDLNQPKHSTYLKHGVALVKALPNSRHTGDVDDDGVVFLLVVQLFE